MASGYPREQGLINLKIDPVANLRARKDDGSGQRPGTYLAAGVQDQLAINRGIGAFIRTRVGISMKNHIDFGPRKAASTGTLHRVTLNERNQVITKEFVGVGVESYLDSSEARYWRTFEEGSAFWGFEGTVLRFKFPSKKGGSVANSTGRGVPFPVAHGMLPGIRTAGDEGKGTFVVTHEIEPANIYRDVYESNKDKIGAFALQGVYRYLDKYLGEEIVVAGKDFLPPGL